VRADDRMRVASAKLGALPYDDDALDALCSVLADAMDPRRSASDRGRRRGE
jgi:hypothetical protein